MDKIISSRGHLVHKLRAVDTTGRPAYYFVLIEPYKEAAFQAALKSGRDTLNFKDFGKIIASCYGDQPNEEVKKLLKDKYGFDV